MIEVLLTVLVFAIVIVATIIVREYVVWWRGRAGQTCRGNPDRTAHAPKLAVFTGGQRGTDAAHDTRYGADLCGTCGDYFIWVGEWHFHGRGALSKIPTRVGAAPPRVDMYGHEIRPLDAGYGVSTSFYSVPAEGPLFRPLWTFFHQSDAFRQALFSVQLGDQFSEQSDRHNAPLIIGAFYDRIDDLMASKPHGEAR